MDSLYSESVATVLSEQATRVYEAKAILEMVSELLTSGPATVEEQGRCMSAVDAAIRILQPVPRVLDCRMSMRKAVEQVESEERERDAVEA